MIMILQTNYANIEFDNIEKDVVMIWQNECEESNVIHVEREKLQEFINHLQTLVR